MKRRVDTCSRNRAFTIMELVVVVVLLTVSAGLVVPRLVGGEDRKVRAGAERVGELLSALARRDAMLSQPMVLLYDAARERLYGEVLLREGGEAAWREDRLLPEASLQGLKVVSVQSDGAELDATNLRVELDQFSPRPAMRVVISDARERYFWSVDMPASALQAMVVPGDVRTTGAGEAATDLDDAGLSESGW
jgi:type II secretory pathway pseudopilin PulG